MQDKQPKASSSGSLLFTIYLFDTLFAIGEQGLICGPKGALVVQDKQPHGLLQWLTPVKFPTHYHPVSGHIVVIILLSL